MLLLAHLWSVPASSSSIPCRTKNLSISFNVYLQNFVHKSLLCVILSSDLQSPDEIVDRSLTGRDGSTTCEDFVSLVQSWLSKIQVFILFDN